MRFLSNKQFFKIPKTKKDINLFNVNIFIDRNRICHVLIYGLDAFD